MASERARTTEAIARLASALRHRPQPYEPETDGGHELDGRCWCFPEPQRVDFMILWVHKDRRPGNA